MGNYNYVIENQLRNRKPERKALKNNKFNNILIEIQLFVLVTN